VADSKVEFELVSPERLVLSEPVDMVVVPGSEGDFGVLVQHAPMVSAVRPGVISVHDGGQVTERIFVAGGFAEVTARRCTVLAEQALPVADIDRPAVEQQLKDAQEDLVDAQSDPERKTAEQQIAVAEAMLQAAGS